MKKPLLHKTSTSRQQRGVTIALVAIAMVAIIAMAALSIDVVTLYLAREEAKRAADQAALAAARVISVSGLTGDPTNASGDWGPICGPDDGVNGVATRAAKAVIGQNTVGGSLVTTVNVTYSAGSNGAVGSGTTDCTSLSNSAFGVNPMVTVQVTRTGLGTYFSRIWGNSGNSVSASSTAEAFNSSDSGAVGNQVTGTIIPVQPRCVKPWVVPNQNPLIPLPSGGQYCNNGTVGACQPLVNLSDGSIANRGISLNGSSTGGIIGETFWLVADCQHNPNNCTLRIKPPQANYYQNGNVYEHFYPNLYYVPAQIASTPSSIPSCTTGDPYNEAIVGCDQAAKYQCGVQNGSWVDLSSENAARPTTEAAQCLIHQTDSSDSTQPTGQDYLNTFAAPSSYPFQILAGTSSPLVGAGLAQGTQITNSASIVSLPIYDQGPNSVNSNQVAQVTVVGFLQVFINAFDTNGNINVTVLNISGCSNGSNGNVGSSPVNGTSPVPIRLITPP